MTNAPIVEVIAELRWGEGNPNQPAALAFANDSDYIRFGVEVGKLGYNQLERTLPQGMPGPGGAVGYRYRKSDGEVNTLYQLGVGVFTANGLAPYTSWDAFRKVLEQGVAALNEVSPISRHQEVWCIVKYLDFFDEGHLAGLAASEFFSEVVGVKYQGLETSAALDRQGSGSSMRFFYSNRDASGRELALDVGEGGVHDKTGIVMNTTVTSESLKDVDVGKVMQCFSDLQKIAHDAFFEMINRSPRIKANLKMGEG